MESSSSKEVKDMPTNVAELTSSEVEAEDIYALRANYQNRKPISGEELRDGAKSKMDHYKKLLGMEVNED